MSRFDESRRIDHEALKGIVESHRLWSLTDGVDGKQANLDGANLERADLSFVDLRKANLRDAVLLGADLDGALLFEANLQGAVLWGARLRSTQLQGANLTNAQLDGAFLEHALLEDADMTGARFGQTTFSGIDLSCVKGLATAVHGGPSTIGIDSFYRSQGMIPESFLRGCGVPESFITLVPSLTTTPIDFNSCFISYSSGDQAFADKLHRSLRAGGVRCWYAPEDLKIGQKIRPTIEQSIQLHDKLLLILSTQSVESDWVEDEVESAFEKEQRQKPPTPVLFPIRIDNAVFDTAQSFAAKIRRTRHIGDFTNWRDPAAYQLALDRLLKDLC